MENKLSRDVYIAYIIKVAVGFLLFVSHSCMYVTLFHKISNNVVKLQKLYDAINYYNPVVVIFHVDRSK